MLLEKMRERPIVVPIAADSTARGGIIPAQPGVKTPFDFVTLLRAVVVTRNLRSRELLQENVNDVKEYLRHRMSMETKIPNNNLRRCQIYLARRGPVRIPRGMHWRELSFGSTALPCLCTGACSKTERSAATLRMMLRRRSQELKFPPFASEF